MSKTQDILKTRKRLLEALPKLSGTKAIQARKKIKQIDEFLSKRERLQKEKMNLGGLDYQVPSPPGNARLVPLPFYPVSVNSDIVTSGGQGVSSSQNPSVIAMIGNTVPHAIPTFYMQTPQISWANLRVVGFEIEYKTLCAQDQSPPTLLVNDLKIGGSTNLFAHDQFADGSMYSKDLPGYTGLRDYPRLEAPNVAMVAVSAVSPVATGDKITFSMSLICDVIDDANYGKHLVGPYARGNSMVRYSGRLTGRK